MLYPDINSQKKTQQKLTRYRTALYLRLSREDGDKTESDSIEVFNDERVKISFTFEDTLKSYETG